MSYDASYRVALSVSFRERHESITRSQSVDAVEVGVRGEMLSTAYADSKGPTPREEENVQQQYPARRAPSSRLFSRIDPACRSYALYAKKTNDAIMRGVLLFAEYSDGAEVAH